MQRLNVEKGLTLTGVFVCCKHATTVRQRDILQTKHVYVGDRETPVRLRCRKRMLKRKNIYKKKEKKNGNSNLSFDWFWSHRYRYPSGVLLATATVNGELRMALEAAVSRYRASLFDAGSYFGVCLAIKSFSSRRNMLLKAQTDIIYLYTHVFRLLVWKRCGYSETKYGQKGIW